MIIIIPIMIVIFSLLAYKKWNPILLAPFVAVITCLIGNIPVLETMLDVYMPSVASFISTNFFIFFLGALFGSVMELSGAAQAIALYLSKITKGKYIIPLIMTISGILAYGGVIGFVVYFSVYPISLYLCKNNNISRALIPGAISAGCWTWAMSMPGAPSIPNVLPTKYLGTSPMSDALPGFLFSGVLLYIMCFVYLEWQTKKYRDKSMGFVDDEHTKTVINSTSLNSEFLPNIFASFLPLVILLVMFNILKIKIEYALLAGVLSGLLLFFKRSNPSEWLEKLNEGAKNSAITIMNTSMVIGFAGVIKETDAFANLIDGLSNLSLPPLIFVAVTVSLSAAAAASASGGIGVALTTFGDMYSKMGIAPEIVHRISTVACGTLDSLPHTGGQVSLLNITHQTHKEAYIHMFVTCTLFPIVSVVCIILWHTILG
ncbi:GntP family permease [Peptoniphilus catoniae]|uniref:GntP family permease n=1 Tax=Peptoniphilus catoniae TaxID=1660341 RepID=UPI0010FF592C|nr:Na+/H+ antiporter NhaC family protein [Peptoniphilus catoniae]